MQILDDRAALVNAALDCARRGWRVLPVHTIRDGCCTCNDPACKSPAKHPRLSNWPALASTSPETIRRWWAFWKTANVGIATGAGLLVLDVDPRHGGDATLAELERTHGLLPDTP